MTAWYIISAIVAGTIPGLTLAYVLHLRASVAMYKRHCEEWRRLAEDHDCDYPDDPNLQDRWSQP